VQSCLDESHFDKKPHIFLDCGQFDPNDDDEHQLFGIPAFQTGEFIISINLIGRNFLHPE